MDALVPWQAVGVVAPLGGRKSLQTQSFWQQMVPVTKGMVHAKPDLHRVSSAPPPRISPPEQSLSWLQPAEQSAVVGGV